MDKNLIKKLAAKGIVVVPVEGGEPSDQLLADALGLAEQGASASELNEVLSTSVFSPKPGKGDPAPTEEKPESAPEVKAEEKPAATPPPGMVMLSESALRDMMQAAATTAVRIAMEAIPAPRASEPTQVVMAAPEKKPLYPTLTDVPEQFWSDKPLIVFHAGDHHTMDGFMADGRYKPCPRSILLLFTSTQVYNAKRFGDSTQIMYVCQYKTHDKREIEMFMSDVRWGSEYWDGSGRSKSMDADVEMSMLVSQKIQALSGLGFEALKSRCVNANPRIEITNIRQMAAELAVREARAHFLAQQKIAKDRTDAALKDNLLAGGGDSRFHMANTRVTSLEETPAGAAAR